ncbi:MAG: hypothetical protein GY710_02390 [Desulfobacteraceae bacterium]|nr:hypothetical protein [Desulfobacteraceae bacterium]
MKIIQQQNNVKFPFEYYCNLFISLVPPSDLIGISEIRFIERFIHPKSNQKALAHYLRGMNGKTAVIEIHIPNLLKLNISQIYYEMYPEIAALNISGIIFHEIGHHVHQFKRHSVKNIEKFADSYSKAGYFKYLQSRQQKILKSLTWASINLIQWNKKERAEFKKSKKKLTIWLKENPKGLPFP